jgi:predicted deacylase
MAHLGMIAGKELEIPDARIYERSQWVRAQVGASGFFFPTAELGDVVEVGEVLGTIIDPLTDESSRVTSTLDGEIIGMAVSQPVLPGYALFHLAWHE